MFWSFGVLEVLSREGIENNSIFFGKFGKDFELSFENNFGFEHKNEFEIL